jgi:predicted phosphohydrolase
MMIAKTTVCLEKYMVNNAIFENWFSKMKPNLLVLLVCMISGTNSLIQVTSDIQVIDQVSGLSFK